MDLTKEINKLSLDLKATQDDLSKSKAALESSRADISSLTVQRDEARATADAIPIASPEHVAEVARLASELSYTKDDLAAVTDQLSLTRASLTEMSDKHTRQLEEVAKTRADEVLSLRSTYDHEVGTLAAQKSELLVKLSDLEGELATAKANLAAQATQLRSNGAGTPAASSPGVTKEELQRLHEAHSLKIYDLQAEHDRAIRALRDEMEAAQSKIGELQQDISRKAMEIQYLEQDQDESQEQITRLKEDLETLTEKFSKTSG
ncbi:hypothetical protein BDQ17DRAFT_1341205 [Cyathus striatus]|nr:hypothetical protein BDQ17DRAFT_1341205 [Cyathus striatus]